MDIHLDSSTYYGLPVITLNGTKYAVAVGNEKRIAAHKLKVREKLDWISCLFDYVPLTEEEFDLLEEKLSSESFLKVMNGLLPEGSERWEEFFTYVYERGYRHDRDIILDCEGQEGGLSWDMIRKIHYPESERSYVPDTLMNLLNLSDTEKEQFKHPHGFMSFFRVPHDLMYIY